MTKLVDRAKCMFCASTMVLLVVCFILNAVMTHGNNTFRLQTALGMNLEGMYCEEYVQ